MSAHRVLVVLALLAMLGTAAPTGAAESPFRDLEPAAQRGLPARAGAGEIPLPRRFRTLEVDVQALRDLLGRAPAERWDGRGGEPGALELALPYPDGTDRLFRVEESPILEPALAAKFPEIHTYVAQGIDDPTATARLSLTSLGFHAMVLSAAGTVYIDPYHKADARFAVSYFKADAVRAAGAPFHCDVKGDVKGDDPEAAAARESRDAAISLPAAASGGTLRTYRLALAATGEYSAAVCAPNPAAVDCALNAMVVSMNRVDGIYEREVAIRMVLVGNDDLVVYTNGATDPYANNDGITMLGQNQTNLNNVIGTANYDVGHVFSTGGGGIAQLAVPCTSAKAMGVTGSGNPVGDGFDVDYVAHEMGHQFGADHTFNGTTESCGGNRASTAAYEPGSGTTIMAYVGICGAEDLQPHSDDTFHTKSFDQIVAFSTGISGRSCAVATTTGNTAPAVNAGAAHTIPKGTPFTLTGSATDADGDPLTYLWEEFDLGTASPPNDDVAAARPIFRTFVPLTVPSRTFPRLADILANLPTLGESMSTRNRTMTFRLTARDNRAGGGGVGYASTTVTVNAAAGPFAITQPAAASRWSGNSVQTVIWNVAGTAAAPVSCASVEIDLSTDGGATFPTVLLAATPNDGAEPVTIPDTPTAQARVRVACVGNVFFDISKPDFTIVADDGLPAPTLTAIAPTSGSITGGTAVTLTGTGFLSGATVLFGTTPSASVTFVGATTLTAVTPAGAAGTVAVTVDNPDAKSANLPSAFQYFDHSGMLIFKDGVESGDLSLWGGITP